MSEPAVRRPKRLNRAQKKAVTRRKLLDAALTLFSERGFHAVSLEELAEEAEFSRGAVYSNFKDKDDLLLSILEEHFLERAAQLKRSVGSGTATEKVTAEMAREFMRGFADDPSCVQLVIELWVRAARDPDLKRRFSEVYESFVDALAEVVELQATGRGRQLVVPAKEVATAILAVSHGVAMERILDPERAPETLMERILIPYFLASGTAAEAIPARPREHLKKLR